MVWDSFDEVAAANDIDFSRSFEEDDTRCFWDKSCENFRSVSTTKATWAGLITMSTTYTTQHRWVETDAGWMHIQRQWLNEISRGDCCGFVMHESYFIGMDMVVQGKTLRVMSRWLDFDYEDFSSFVADPEGLVIGNIKDDAQNIEDWMTEHGDRVK